MTMGNTSYACDSVAGASDKLSEKCQQTPLYEHEDKENFSQNTVGPESPADGISKNVVKDEYHDGRDDSTAAVARLPCSGTTDDLEELVTQASADCLSLPPADSLSTADSGAEDMVKTAVDEPERGSSTEAFSFEETKFIFDWDDTILPSTWVQRQGLTLDDSTQVNDWQREQLDEVAALVAETLRLAKQYGEVVFVTNAEHGWVPLSCQKFMPSLYPLLEDVSVLSARTTYESPQCRSPLEWKLRAFNSEMVRLYGVKAMHDPAARKNVLGLGDSVHEREALLRATADLPNCCSKSLKFVERPDLTEMLRQHTLVTSHFSQIVQHNGNLDLLIKCN